MWGSPGINTGAFVILLLFYVNDMSQAVSCDILLYADDSCLVFDGKYIDTIETTLNKDFNTLCDWFVDNKIFWRK